MKRFWAISFLLMYLAGATECSQLLKFPMLVSHFTDHKTTNEQISFAGFLYMHYLGDDQDNNDQEKDEKLPFKSYGNAVSVDIMYPPSETASFSIQIVSPVIKKFSCTERFSDTSSYLSGIWQPPKSC